MKKGHTRKTRKTASFDSMEAYRGHYAPPEETQTPSAAPSSQDDAFYLAGVQCVLNAVRAKRRSD